MLVVASGVFNVILPACLFFSFSLLACCAGSLVYSYNVFDTVVHRSDELVFDDSHNVWTRPIWSEYYIDLGSKLFGSRYC